MGEVPVSLSMAQKNNILGTNQSEVLKLWGHPQRATRDVWLPVVEHAQVSCCFVARECCNLILGGNQKFCIRSEEPFFSTFYGDR